MIKAISHWLAPHAIKPREEKFGLKLKKRTEKIGERKMGVDFYTCENCGYNFPDCGPYFSCYSCESRFCSTKCGGRKLECEQEEKRKDGSSWFLEVTSCVLCRKEEVTDRSLMLFLLKRCSLSYDEAVELYKKED